MSRFLPVVFVVLGVLVVVMFFVANSRAPRPTPIQGSGPEVALTQEPPEEPPRLDLLLPDMQLEPPSQLYISNAGGVKKIRFDTTFSNIGRGPMELVGVADEARNVTIATQRMKKIDGTFEEAVIGEFVYHPGHKHWHVDRYAQFQLYSYDAISGLGELVAQTDKFSFCIWDEKIFNANVPGTPPNRVYLRCVSNLQGNSVGWGDTYTPNLAGQELDITNVPDGDYAVRSVVNADRAIHESNYSNNDALLYVRITGNSIEIIENITDEIEQG